MCVCTCFFCVGVANALCCYSYALHGCSIHASAFVDVSHFRSDSIVNLTCCIAHLLFIFCLVTRMMAREVNSLRLVLKVCVKML